MTRRRDLLNCSYFGFSVLSTSYNTCVFRCNCKSSHLFICPVTEENATNATIKTVVVGRVYPNNTLRYEGEENEDTIWPC